MVRYIGIDPSTKTGLVIMDEEGKVWYKDEITTGLKSDPIRFMTISGYVIQEIYKNSDGASDIKVMIEGFSYGSKGKGVSTQYGIGWGIRTRLVEQGIKYIEVPPTTLKKFATGKGNTKKEDMILPIYKRWGFEDDSDNIRDAFVLAMIGRALDGLGEPTKAQMDCIKGLKQ